MFLSLSPAVGRKDIVLSEPEPGAEWRILSPRAGAGDTLDTGHDARMEHNTLSKDILIVCSQSTIIIYVKMYIVICVCIVVFFIVD